MKAIADQARNRWQSILPMFGISPKFLDGKQCPCPLCGGKDRFRFDNKEGRGTWICNACGAGDGMHLVMLKTGMEFKDAVRAVREHLSDTFTTKPKPQISEEFALKLRRELYKASSPISGCMAEAYLRNRGFMGPYPDALRFVPLARLADEARSLPAMIAMVSDRDGKIVNLHRTFLEHGQKAKIEKPRAMMPGKMPDGASIRLGPVTEHLGIAEGIETALAVKKRFGVNCWSAICSSMLEKFAPPDGVTKLTIYGDNDTKFGGQASAYRLAHRLMTLPKPVSVDAVEIPYTAGTDWADTVVKHIKD